MAVNKPRNASMQRILLAEDDDDMRRFLERELKRAGYDVVSFGNGMLAYERLCEEPFTLLLTDMSCRKWMALSWPAVLPNSILISRSCSLPALQRWRSIPIPRLPEMRGFSPSHSICAIWSARSNA